MHEHGVHRLTVSCFFMQAILIAIMSSASALAQTSRFAVEFPGASALKPLLEKHLPIVRAAADAAIADEEWQVLVQNTPQQIRDLLSTEGYFSPAIRVEDRAEERAEELAEKRPEKRAEDQAEKATGKQHHLVRFYVNPGEPVRVTEIQLEFTGEIQTRQEGNAQRLRELRQQWSLHSGDRFTQSAWDKAKTEVLRKLHEEDFPSARIIASSATIDPETHRAQLQIAIDSGPVFTLGALDIHGLSRYPAAWVERINPLRPGEPYRQERLPELQSRLLDTGYFRSVFVTIDPDPDHAQDAPVRVEVSENPAKRLSVGIGISSDVGARLQLKWLNRHFLGEDWRLESVVRADRLSQLAQSELYFQPLEKDWLAGKFEGWIPSVAIALERTSLTGIDIDRIRHSARLSTPSRTNERVLSLSFLADRRTIPGFETRTRQALVAGYAWTRRRFDQPLSPTRGYSAGIDLSAGVGGALNEDSIARVLLSGVWLRPLHTRWTAALRLQAGQLRGAHTDSVPEDLLFRTGGDQTVRGYGYGKLGVPRNNVIVGGNVMAVISTELIYRINPHWGIALFHDAGDAALSWQTFRWRRGVGIGARWRSPIGALNVDIARGLDQGETRLHFSVGYGF